MMSGAQVIAGLLTNAEQFLRENCLLISGGAGGNDAGPAAFWMQDRSSGGYLAQKMSAANAEGKTNILEAWYVPMQQLGSPGNPTFTANWLPTAEESGIRLMLTSQITACLFAMGASGGKTCVAHIQPDQAAHQHLPEATRQDFRQSDLRMSARVKGLKTFAAQGVDYDRKKNDCITIVGVRDKDDRWTIFKQKWSTATNTVIEVTRS
jgi:hypothetical protein